MPDYHGAKRTTSLSSPSAEAPARFIDSDLVIFRRNLQRRRFERQNISISAGGFDWRVAADADAGQKIDQLRPRWRSAKRCLIRCFGSRAMCYLWICYRWFPAHESHRGQGHQYWLDYRPCAAPQNDYPKYWKLANTAINFLQAGFDSPIASTSSPLCTFRMQRCCVRLGVTGFVSTRCLCSGSESAVGCSRAQRCQTGLGWGKLAEKRNGTSLRPSCRPFYCFSCWGISDYSLKMFIQII